MVLAPARIRPWKYPGMMCLTCQERLEVWTRGTSATHTSAVISTSTAQVWFGKEKKVPLIPRPSGCSFVATPIPAGEGCWLGSASSLSSFVSWNVKTQQC